MHQPPQQQQQLPPAPNTFANPPQWGAFITYPPGAVVSYAGGIWRCETAHTSWQAPGGSPNANLHMWTPIGSMPNPYAQQTFYTSPPPYDVSSNSPSGYSFNAYPSSSGSAPLQAGFSPSPSTTQPPPIPSHPSYRSDEKNSAPASGETPHADEKSLDRGTSAGGSSAMQFFEDKASEAFRYITMREEAHKARDKDELKHELGGERVWRVGGVGVWAYSEDQRDEEAKKDAWRKWSGKHGKDDWVKLARERTEFYTKDSKGVKPLFSWKLVEKGQRLPPDALPIGNEQDGAVLYAARAWWEGGVHLGKAGHHIQNGASISYGGGEITIDTYEVFCGPINEPYLVKWMTFPHGQRASVQGWQPVEGGREKDGTYILLSKGDFENGQHPGKCLINDDHACVGWGGGELWVRPFQILAYANPDRR
ncbi:hypothetical protein IAT38_008074 [Cryptococcus sp. DSM 104549]